MLNQTFENETGTQERHTARVIHYNLSYILLVGHGIGGGVAQVLATRLSRERVAALVLIDTIAYEYTFAPDWPLPDMKQQQEPDRPKETELEEMMHELQETLPKGTQYPDRFKQVMNDWIAPWDSELGKELLFQQIRLLHPNYSNSAASDLKVLGKPTMIIWGEHDAQIPLKIAQRLHHDIPESRLVIIPDAGHLILFDAPDDVAGAIRDFVGRL